MNLSKHTARDNNVKLMDVSVIGKILKSRVYVLEEIEAGLDSFIKVAGVSQMTGHGCFPFCGPQGEYII